MDGLRQDTQEDLDALNATLTQCIKDGDLPQYIKDGVEIYSYGITHPTDGSLVLVIDQEGIYWDCVSMGLSTDQLNNIETLTEDWFPEPPSFP